MNTLDIRKKIGPLIDESTGKTLAESNAKIGRASCRERV